MTINKNEKKSAIYNTNKTTKKSDTSKHYIDRERFNRECTEYYEKKLQRLKEGNETPPPINSYLGECLLEICEKVSHARNFVGYSFREDMVNEAVWDCVKALQKSYNPHAKTRTNKPNAFAYFSQIAGWAMVRVIKKEKGVIDFKNKLLTTANPYDFIDDTNQDAAYFIENLIAMNIKD